MAYQETGTLESPELMSLKCARCLDYLRNPVQLSSCFHIFCADCLPAVSNIRCPKCDKESPCPDILQSISGIGQIRRKIRSCDECNDISKSAQWNCITCGYNLCAACRVHHPKDHKCLISSHRGASQTMPEDRSDGGILRSNLSDEFETDSDHSVSNSSIRCPMCTGASCEHCKKLLDLMAEPERDITKCKIPGHTDSLRFLCLKCWIIVCGDCSQKGEHKLHETKSLSLIQEFLKNAENKQSERLEILITACQQDMEEEKGIERRLDFHINLVQVEMNKRRQKILQAISHAFEKAVRAVELQGKDILAEYRIKMAEVIHYNKFLEQVMRALENIKIGEEYDPVQYINAYEKQSVAEELITDLQMAVDKLTRPSERRLVLPQMKDWTVIPPALARVGTEWKSLKLVASFRPGDISLFHSIVARNDGTCLLSCQRGREEQFDTLLLCDLEGKCEKYDIEQGRYYVSQLSSGELVASVRQKFSNGEQYYAVQYYDGEAFENQCAQNMLEFQTIKEVTVEPLGIATTKDNLILLCSKPVEKGKYSPGYLMLMTLQGKQLKAETNPDMGSPDYVAISDDGEICVTDTENSSVIILDQELQIEERMTYKMATSLVAPSNVAEGDLKFSPCGVCYDHYGRIIVADPDNHCVVRLVRDIETREYKMEPLLTKSDDLLSFSGPKLVAMAKDSRLWVVCSEYVFVFEYCS